MHRDRAFSDVVGRNKAVSIVLPQSSRPSQLQRPLRRASTSCRTRSMAGTPPFVIYASGVSPPNTGLLFGNETHTSANLSLYTIFKALKIPRAREILVSWSWSSFFVLPPLR